MIRSFSAALCICFVILCIITSAVASDPDTLLSGNIVPGNENSTLFNRSDQLPESSIAHLASVQPDSYFDIRFVSPEILDRIRSNQGSEDTVLKTEPGMVIGLVSGEILYIRADLNDTIIPMREKKITKDDISYHLIDIVFGTDNAKTKT
ncbi:MAG TPA: hypothetical protein VN372_01010, partial [Methanospirillum sp.]|nr:hypothetical protein [Methanospirillum sp.]